ncbi:MAG: tetratricopeptide repeat protein, partial [Planctomycetia bacterium]
MEILKIFLDKLKKQKTRILAWGLDKVIKNQPECLEAYEKRGQLRESCKDIDGAIADYTRVIELDPESSKAYYNRGRLYQRQECLNAALSDLEQALAINPNLANAHEVRGTTLFE